MRGGRRRGRGRGRSFMMIKLSIASARSSSGYPTPHDLQSRSDDFLSRPCLLSLPPSRSLLLLALKSAESLRAKANTRQVREDEVNQTEMEGSKGRARGTQAKQGRHRKGERGERERGERGETGRNRGRRSRHAGHAVFAAEREDATVSTKEKIQPNLLLSQ
eukprot:764861-Hanusia_phi.AAC.8